MDKGNVLSILRCILHCKYIINNEIYASGYIILKDTKNFIKYHIDVSNFNLKLNNIYKIYNKYYTINNLREKIPYYIKFNTETKEFILINREYDGINSYNKDDFKSTDELFLFNDDNPPWNGYKQLQNIIKQYNCLIIKYKLGFCLNKSDMFEDIINRSGFCLNKDE